MRGTNTPAVSVILPVYNVGDYIDTCMDSLCRQTFPDFEMILVDDGSTDDSRARCREWVRKDGRVRLICKENGGVSLARNLGMEAARGEYIAFVDPDDWVAPDYLEKLFSAISAADADFAECDLWRVDGRTGKKIYRSCGGRMGLAYTKPEHMIYGPTATYKSLSRRSLWIDNGIRLPDCSFESPAVYSLILALSHKTVNVPEALYYYRRFRADSLIETGYADRSGRPDPELGIGAMEFLLRSFRERGLLREYSRTLPRIICYRLNDILAMQFHRRTPEDFHDLSERYRDFLGRELPSVWNTPYLTWGGYNLNRIMSHVAGLHDPSGRFNFSSIISVTSPSPRAEEIAHPNRYRAEMIEREWRRDFFRLLEERRPHLIVMDLMEERHDLLQLGESFITLSDAFSGSGLTGRIREGRVIRRNSPEARELFAAAAEEFVRRVKTAVPECRFILVESLLCDSVGDLSGREPFADREQIRRLNDILREGYDVLRRLIPDAVCISPSDGPLFFTDRKYEYGAIPSHLNEIANEIIAGRIETALDIHPIADDVR